jgi:hypothetical protein
VKKMKYDWFTCQGNRDIGDNVLHTLISKTSMFPQKFTPLPTTCCGILTRIT